MSAEGNGGNPNRTGEPATLGARLQQAERRLREVEERYALATSAALEGIYEWDLDAATSALVFTFDGELIRLAAAANLNPEEADAWHRSFPRPPSRDTAATRAVLGCSVVAIPDVLDDPGLAISRKFIELHGGRIRVTSQLGRGSTFAFTLPLAMRPHEGPAVP